MWETDIGWFRAFVIGLEGYRSRSNLPCTSDVRERDYSGVRSDFTLSNSALRVLVTAACQREIAQVNGGTAL